MKFIKYIIGCHKFFVRQSPHYLKGNWSKYYQLTLWQKLYYPIAYIKFIRYSIKDYQTKNKWQLTKINQGYQMTRANERDISCRPLTWFEKIKYYRKLKQGV